MNDFNSYGEEPTVGLQPLFFRVADRMRLEGYVAALVDDNMSLSLVSGHDAILDHYGKLLVARLREAAPHIGLEVYFPASADALITRFNEVLQSYSIEDAMGNKAPAAQPRIWIVHDASALPDHEIQLLARLVQHFPAANIRVVMLLTTASKKQRLLASFGRRILNWEIEPPSQEQAQVMLEQARAQGREGAVSALLKKISGWGAPSAITDHRQEPAITPVVAPEPTAPTPVPAPSAEDKPKKKPGTAHKVLLWLAVALALLVTCALAVLLLYGNGWNAEMLGLGVDNPSVTPANTAASAPDAAAAQDNAASATNSAAPALATSEASAAPVNALGDPATPANTTAAKAPASVAPPATPTAAAEALRSSNPAPATEVEEIIPTTSQAQVGQAWVRQMPAGTFLVQHTIVPGYGEATQWLQAHANLRRARIVATYINGQSAIQFAVVSGPFASIGDANNFANANGVPRGSQIRSARSMKDRFAP